MLYVHGLSTGDFGPALRDLLGEDVSGLSSSSIQRLTEHWQADHAAFKARQLRYAYLSSTVSGSRGVSARTTGCACSS